ncbi:MAG: hypothetical protein WDO19_02880 [Bacteroidota bacterium]
MKNIILAGMFTFCIVTFLSCFHRDRDIKISVKETEDVYRFTASFPESKTRKVQRLINNSISPNSFFSSPDDYLDVSTILQDKTRFSIKASPGKLSIKLDREENTVASYHRVKEMCEEIKNTLKE